MDLDQEKMARTFFVNEVRSSIRDVRTSFFKMLDTLRADDKDNIEQLIELLKDPELARKFTLLAENRTKLFRKEILDATNDCERKLLEYIENFDVKFRDGIQFKGLFKG